MSKWIGRSIAALVCGSFFTLALPGRASEPANNAFPFDFTGFRRELQTLAAPPPNNSTINYAAVDAITPSGDVDYILVTCQGNTIKGVRVYDFQNQGTPDIDIQIYNLGGTRVGISQGVGPEESVDVSALGQQSLYLKVYGYAGAVTNSYSVSISC